MPIPVVKEPDSSPLRSLGLERCCFCRVRTDTWHEKNDVACCEKCASTREEKDLPTKEEWCTKERELMRKEYPYSIPVV